MKFSSIILSLIIFIQSVGLNFEDINKLNNLVKDISCHLEEGETINDFLFEHYYNKSSIEKASLVHHHKHKNHDEHGDLPFQHDCLNSHMNLVYVFSPTITTIEIPDIVSKRDVYAYIERNTSHLENSIFQPPKV
ncbi:hypothetical protein [Lutibacter citreus]|uniref:hypothetical protein n=1 Tax=Lutibacter citreus TaxID=2138210 RepID=UPI0013002D66|nr:hypothetical protein [Lutibacter citreus]